jgi:transposase-like protein
VPLVSDGRTICRDQADPSRTSEHRDLHTGYHSLERLKKEVNRRADVVGIFPNEAAIIRLIGTVLLQRNDEWQPQRAAFGKRAVVKLL